MKDLSMHVMDIIQNSISADAKRIELDIVENKQQNLFMIRISDDGKGMSDEVLSKVTDPFYTSRTTRKVGLGLSLLKQNAERAGGGLCINSLEDRGTVVYSFFEYDHIDRLITGDVAGTMSMMASANPNIDFVYRHNTDNGNYVFDTRDIKEVLGDMDISNIKIVKYLKEMITENINEISI